MKISRETRKKIEGWSIPVLIQIWKQRFEKGYPKKYNTNYCIKDENGYTLLEDYTAACFSRFTSTTLNHTKFGWNPEKKRRMYVYALSNEVKLDEEIVKWWIKQLKGLRLKFRFDILKDYKVPKSLSSAYIGGRLAKDERDVIVTRPSAYHDKQTVYRISFNLQDFTSIDQVKVLTHFFRVLYEYEYSKIIKSTYKIKQKNPKLDFLLSFQLAHVLPENAYVSSGHSLFRQHALEKLASKEMLFKLYDKWANQKYNNDGLESLYFTYSGYAIPNGYIPKDIKQFTEFFKDYKKKK